MPLPEEEPRNCADNEAVTLRNEEGSKRQQIAQDIAHSATSRDILLFLIAFRVLNALYIRTFFQPDEYFQSLEPAWQTAFGSDGGAWITWVFSTSPLLNSTD